MYCAVREVWWAKVLPFCLPFKTTLLAAGLDATVECRNHDLEFYPACRHSGIMNATFCVACLIVAL